MQADEIERELKAFIVREFLDGRDAGLEATTPLLEWGVIDSISIVRLLQFFEQRFGVRIASAQATAQHLQSIQAMTAMLLAAQSGGRAAP
jgi:acyl carrier protein